MKWTGLFDFDRELGRYCALICSKYVVINRVSHNSLMFYAI
jgi:hypothetical protein